ncbi:MAG: endolytic transglycosylase MltG [Acidobacteria bacterium]|nr:endolytic transglycosylase MltG [Acidobacteriota bacterium]
MKLSRILAAVALAGALGVPHYLVRMDSYRGFEQPVFVDIPRGTSSLRIGEKLAEAGVLRNPFLFPLARLTKPSSKPQAGEYRFEKAATPAEVFARIARGDVYLVELRVPEGSDVFDIAEKVAAAGLAPADEFLHAAKTREGRLFPSTYLFRRGITPDEICRAMEAQFNKVWSELKGAAGERQRIVTLASIVETEAVLAEERPKIAGVYMNRLAKGMRLECDPTVEYAAKLDGRWKGVIYKTDLESANPYNTYRHEGLPPGPVANPGRDSLKAALHPEETDALYFVARGDQSGGHVFSKEYSEHQKAVAAYRKGQRNGHHDTGAPK